MHTEWKCSFLNFNSIAPEINGLGRYRANFWRKNYAFFDNKPCTRVSFHPGSYTQLLVACWLSLQKIFSNCRSCFCNAPRGSHDGPSFQIAVDIH